LKLLEEAAGVWLERRTPPGMDPSMPRLSTTQRSVGAS
jgi:hypothetical protein